MSRIKGAIIDGILLFLLILALVGYDQAVRPWMPEHDSHQTVETEYWLDDFAHESVLKGEKK